MTDYRQSRRQWITALARWGALSAAAAVWLRVSWPRTGGERACSDVEGRTGCRACGLLADCGLPRALSVRLFLSQEPKNPRTQESGIQGM